jgi:hypothetical protein
MLTARQKQVLEGKGNPSAVSKRQVRYKTRKKARRALEDLAFLAGHYPESVSCDSLVALVSAMLKQGEITNEERQVQRLPPDFDNGQRKRSPSGKWVQLSGVLREKNGAPLKKPGVYRKIELAHSLIQAIHNELSSLSPLKHARQTVLLTRKEKKQVELSVSRFKCKRQEKAGLNFETGKFEPIEAENLLVLSVGSLEPADLAAIIFSKL